jgi:hypothetical protein
MSAGGRAASAWRCTRTTPKEGQCIRWLTETLFECAREVADAELHDTGEVRNAEAEANIRLDVGNHTFRMPRRKKLCDSRLTLSHLMFCRY